MKIEISETTKTAVLDVEDNFGPDLGLRFLTDGPKSGEEFREALLIPALEEYPEFVIAIQLGDVTSYSVSFLEEIFGGVVRRLGPEVAERIIVLAREDDQDIKLRCEGYLKNAAEIYPKGSDLYLNYSFESRKKQAQGVYDRV